MLQQDAKRPEEEAGEELTTYLFCAVHPRTVVVIRENRYYCPDCRCAPERMLSVDCPFGYTLSSANALPEPLPDTSYFLKD